MLGHQTFVDVGTPLADGSATGNINTAIDFTIGNLMSTSHNSGIFAGMPETRFGSVMFNQNVPTSLSFANAVFGSFTSTSIMEVHNSSGQGAGVVGFFAQGTWTPAARFRSGPLPADFTISFTQTPALDGFISNSATFALPGPSSIPEPSSFGMLLTGLAALLVGYPLRRRSRHFAMT